LSSIKTMHQHIALVTQSSFCAVRHTSSSVLIGGQPTVLTPDLNPVDYRWCMMQERVLIRDMDELRQRLVESETWAGFQQSATNIWRKTIYLQ